jgi:hypothetical protein
MPLRWKARVVHLGPEAIPQFRDSLVGPSGDALLQPLDFDDLAFALLEHRVAAGHGAMGLGRHRRARRHGSGTLPGGCPSAETILDLDAAEPVGHRRR